MSLEADSANNNMSYTCVEADTAASHSCSKSATPTRTSASHAHIVNPKYTPKARHPSLRHQAVQPDNPQHESTATTGELYFEEI